MSRWAATWRLKSIAPEDRDEKLVCFLPMSSFIARRIGQTLDHHRLPLAMPIMFGPGAMATIMGKVAHGNTRPGVCEPHCGMCGVSGYLDRCGGLSDLIRISGRRVQPSDQRRSLTIALIETGVVAQMLGQRHHAMVVPESIATLSKAPPSARRRKRSSPAPPLAGEGSATFQSCQSHVLGTVFTSVGLSIGECRFERQMERRKMCRTCDRKSVVRRDFLKFAAASLAGVALASEMNPARAAEGAPTSLSPDEALAALKEGNARYVSHPELCSIDLAAQRASVAGHQAPWATVIACADSRVPPELIFGGHGVGQLFVARNAGNLIDTATLGTVEYGAAVLGSPLIVVLAHTSCGAVKAACDVVKKNATYPGAIGPMIEPILPAALAARDDPGDYVNATAKRSAQRTAARVTATSRLISGLAGEGKIKIVAAIYDIETGVVSYLS